MIKRVLKSFLMALLHLIFFVVIHEIGVLLFSPTKSNLQWGITLQFSLVVFGALSLTMSLLFEWIEKKKYKHLILISVCVVFSGLFVGNVQYTPNRTLLLLLSGLLGFVLPIFICNLLKKH